MLDILGTVLVVGAVSVASGFLLWGLGGSRERLPTPPPPRLPDTLSDAELQERAQHTIAAAASLKALWSGSYIPHSRLERWRAAQPSPVVAWLLSPQEVARLPMGWAAPYQEAAACLDREGEAWVKQTNDSFVGERLRALEGWFDCVLAHPLTPAQRRAIVIDEDNNLIVAGAGTGKTSTIEARVAYLLQHEQVPPEEILVLSFNKDIVEEVAARLAARGAEGVCVSTFHGLGYRILGASEGQKRAISTLSESAVQRQKLFLSVLARQVQTDAYLHLLSRWFVDLYAERVLLDVCKTPDERLRRELGIGLISLSGQRLASLSEVKVANWLSLNGIAWQHERRYPHSPPSPHRRDYTPDFYLPEQDLWLEVWAVNRRGQTAPTIPAGRYLEDMAWKRALHQANGTRLLEVFQDEIWSETDALGDALTQLLVPAGVVPRALTAQERQALLGEGSVVTRGLLLLVDRFLSLFRGGGWSWAEVQARALSPREQVFLALFTPFEQAYVEALRAEEKIDFADMLLSALGHVTEGRFVGRWRAILVDEFQDTSRLRLALVQGLRSQVPHARLFLVGDDWQSIYRFAGSDLPIFTQATRFIGRMVRTDLDRTFRLNEDILQVSSQFVTRNPLQLQKTIQPHQPPPKSPAINILFQKRQQMKDALQRALDDIVVQRTSEAPLRILVLARYNYLLEMLQALDGAALERDGLCVEGRTIHRSKGLEADHVIVLGLEAAIKGFPAEIEDDPVLRMVTSEKEDFPHAEERRLFYVALTRTRGRAYLLADADSPSAFVQELLEPLYADRVQVLGEISTRYRCPCCQGRTIRRQMSPYGSFWACLHWPRCGGTVATCTDCREGAMVRAAPAGPSRCVSCGEEAEACPRCAEGMLRIRRNAQRGTTFWGCSGWKADGSGCSYTRPVS